MPPKRVPRPRTTRRLLIQGAAATAAFAAFPPPLYGSSRRRQPNILFILADDLGYADISCFGARSYRTPVLDRLAADGLLMTQGYSNSPVCSPTRVALITGRYQYRLRAGIDEPIGPRKSGIGLPPGIPTLPALLRNEGYRTSLVGKWHMGWPPEFGPLQSGYDTFFGIAAGSTNYFTHKSAERGAAERGLRNTLYDGAETIEREGYLTDLLADRAIEEIKEGVRAKSPFFISLHFTAPHSPWQGPGDAADAQSVVSSVHADGGTLEKYSEMIVAMDAAIGRVLQALETAGATRDTIVVFTSDNGGERFSDVWPFSGGKQKLLEGGIRVPLIVRWPGLVAPGTRTLQVMTSMDWAPTLLAAAGRPTGSPRQFDGMNLLPVLSGGPPVPRQLFWRMKRDDQAAVRSGDWKYLRRRGREYLFDLTSDPRERANLKMQHPELFAALKQDFDRWNATMLSYPDDSFSAGGGPGALADD